MESWSSPRSERQIVRPRGLVALFALVSAACPVGPRAGGADDGGTWTGDGGADAGEAGPMPDGSVADAGPPWQDSIPGRRVESPEAWAPCPDSLNPTGDFANTLIRGVDPGSDLGGNTWEALAEADALGWEYVEVDVRISADGYLVPAREDDLSGWSDCEGSLAESTMEDLAGCTYAGTTTPLAPIDDGLEDASFLGVYVDLKSTGSEPLSSAAEVVEAVTGLVDRLGIHETVVAMSYSEEVATALLDAEVRTALKGYPEGLIERLGILVAAAVLGAEMVCIPAVDLQVEDYERAAEEGLWLLPWAYAREVNSHLVARVVGGRAGGLISSVPDRVSELVDAFCED